MYDFNEVFQPYIDYYLKGLRSLRLQRYAIDYDNQFLEKGYQKEFG